MAGRLTRKDIEDTGHGPHMLHIACFQNDVFVGEKNHNFELHKFSRYHLKALFLLISIYSIPYTLTVIFSRTRSVRYSPIFHTLYFTVDTEHARIRYWLATKVRRRQRAGL